eukprot:m.179270 g.179270  ORF g.179270 m.179270 type:complete len:1023 (-) comp31966_c0_seq1:244-3312(-)
MSMFKRKMMGSIKAASAFKSKLSKKKGKEEEAEEDTASHVTAVNRNRVIRNKSVKVDEEWLSEIPSEFFDEEFDSSKYILESTDALDEMELHEFRENRFQELHAVSRKFSGLVNNNAEEFVQELTRVSELQDQLVYATIKVKSQRAQLKRADDVMVKALDIVRQNQRKKVLTDILHAVTEIGKLSKAQETLVELLKKKSFVEAIELARTSTEKLIEYSDRGFTIVDDLATNLQDTTLLIEEHVDNALCVLCSDFELNKYEEIVQAYDMLGRPHAACDRLGSYFVQAMQVKTKQVLRKHTGRRNPKVEKRTTSLTGDITQFKQLCKGLKTEKFEPCLMDFCGVVCELMVNYDAIVAWHRKKATASDPTSNNDDTNTKDDSETETETDPDPSNVNITGDATTNDGADDTDNTTSSTDEELVPKKKTREKTKQSQLDLTDDSDPLESISTSTREMKLSKSATNMSAQEYESMKLEVHRRRLWQDVQRQVAIFLHEALHEIDLSEYPLPQYLQLLSHVRRLINIGESFSGLKADILELAIRKNSLTYLAAFHTRVLSQIKNMINQDEWEALDVVKDFNIFLLKEFSFLRQRQQKGLSDESLTNTTLAEFRSNPEVFKNKRTVIPDADVQEISIKGGTTTPTKITRQPSLTSTPVATPVSTPSKLVERMSSDGSGTPSKSRPPPPHCSGTAMALVRFCGRYLQIMDVLKPVAAEAFQCITEVYAFFYDATWGFFSTDCTAYSHGILSPKVHRALERCRQVKQPSQTDLANVLFDLWMEPPVLSENCELDSEANLHGLQYRITGLESLTFLSTVLRSIKANIVRRLPPACHKFMNTFYTDLVETVPELRWFVYKGTASKLLRFESMLKAMGSVKWDVKEIMSQHNPYIDKLVADINIVAQRMAVMGDTRLPAVSTKLLWGEINEEINRMFVEGFASAKKCTSEGRALMQLDYRQYLSKMSKISVIKPPTAHVDDFIRAFYLQIEEFEDWLRAHAKQYTKKELANVVNVTSVKLAKKDKQRLLKLLDDI